MATIPVQALCNTILMRARKDKIDITPMKLQKLLYFIYRDYLQESQEVLFSEQFECWQYGPVLPSVYHEFKSFKSNPITQFAKNADGSASYVSLDRLPVLSTVVENVWSRYGGATGIALSTITHKEGSAWYRAFEQSKPTLDAEAIKNDHVC